MAGRAHKKSCRKLMRVSRNFAAWVRPILYESVRISKYLHLFSLLPRGGDPLRRSSFVKHLFINTPFDAAFDLHLLNSCERMQSLAIHGPTFKDLARANNRGIWSSSNVACRPSSVLLFDANCDVFRQSRLDPPAVLRYCTHLIVEHSSIDIRSVSFVLSISPQVTHLALCYTYPRLFALQHLEEVCHANPQLEVIALVQFVRRTTKAFDDKWCTTNFGVHSFERVDPRVAFVEVFRQNPDPEDNWAALTTGNLDVWELSRERVAVVKRTEILPETC
ncbi:hypothetical protein SISNIDRAFT_490702 [Sistotremastrum niveocremeum HHB9708]|uniref:F-box domain-containing protein n=1 Tax=Sistotremastrum niveocremeum HHB9708 TaxID=1314777 RepID=A0A164NP34_9AGAM|nr:hypothetical protein SISNIDRAFT_490702 [Sistotremastrum niveocremeum HHB9708]